ncbi:glycosyltransferase family 4 protein [Pseudonocardia sp. WMMC193]|uniref:glycosyltransferase family 4 protein n=1 Tax=Pseudonocardia sp. WMMC193 TaxID=2911965 RepID=UPI001F30C831|nr:glycosyltransferase family 4 protein [Pseudonocardia sp. WMMC193]MCF7553806.1 glycosyltransferase family 4 protein [Pseudonocardia sp. WMMC193]
MTGHTPTSTGVRALKVLAHQAALEPYGGVEVCTFEDSLALARRGHHVDVAFGADGSLRTPYEAGGVGLGGPFRFDFSPARALTDVRRHVPAARWARSRRPDVLWLNRAEHIVWGQVVARAARCPIVCHLHGPPVYRRQRLVTAGVAHLVAVSDFVRRAYVDLGVPEDRISVLHNALDPARHPVGGLAERAAARRALDLPADPPIVLGYGQMTEAKGALVLVEAWRRLAAARPDALLVLVDSHPHPDPAFTRALETVPQASYRLFGLATDVVPFLHAADVVAFPSLLPEAFGRVVVEGLGTGRPVVASRVGAVPEILTGDLARFLVEPGAVTELALALGRLLDWRRDEPGLADACAAHVATRFAMEPRISRLEGILAEVAG